MALGGSIDTSCVSGLSTAYSQEVRPLLRRHRQWRQRERTHQAAFTWEVLRPGQVHEGLRPHVQDSGITSTWG